MSEEKTIMNNLEFNLPEPTTQKTTWREEMIEEFVDGINAMREKQGWCYTDRKGKKKKLKPVTKRQIALRLNKNPFTAGKSRDGEVSYILTECKKKGFEQFFYKT